MSPAFEPYDVAVVGAGISGLACAWKLRRAGLRVTVLEAGDSVGGCISTTRREGSIADGGPQTFAASPAFLDLVALLGIDDKLQRAQTASGAMYIYSRGRLHPAPTSPGRFFASQLLSPFAKMRLLAEPLIVARTAKGDESLADFAARRGGKAIVDALVRPLVAGIFAGAPEKLSARSAFPGLVDSEQRYASVMIGAVARRRAGGGRRPTPLNFAGGNDALPLALAAGLAPEVRLGVRVGEIILRGANVEVAYDGAQSGSVVARHAVLAIPADVSGGLLRRLEPDAASALKSINYAPLAQIALSYPRSAVGVRLDGFGFLSGANSGLRILGCTWNSAMFSDRCEPDRVLVTVFVGGVGDASVAQLPDEQLVRVAHKDLRRVLEIREAAPEVVAGFRWERAIPQYELGHSDRLKVIDYGMSRLVQISLTGNYFAGPSIGECIAYAAGVAKNVAARLGAESRGP
jgi:oxygen-dependent protoporphyrinogen oxidase